MTENPGTVSFRLRVRRDRTTGAWWLAAPVEIGDHIRLWMVPNTIALRSVITLSAWRLLRAGGLVGADIVDFRTRRQTGVVRRARLGGFDIPDFAVQVRDIEGLRAEGEPDPIDGYLGLDFLLDHFETVALDTRRFEVTLRLKS